MRWIIICLLTLFSYMTIAQKFESISTVWSGQDAWEQWRINSSEGSGKLHTIWPDDPYEWRFYLPGDDGTIQAVWSDDDSRWRLSSDKSHCQIRQEWIDDWHSWEITCDSTEIDVRTSWSGDDAWDEWRATSNQGEIRIRARWSDDWTDWDIDDQMKAPVSEKLAVIFIAIYTAQKIGKKQQK